MTNQKNPRLQVALAGLLGLVLSLAASAATEFNPVRSHPVQIGPEASRLVVGFRATSGNAVTTAIRSRAKAQVMRITQAQTSRADVAALTSRTGLGMSGSRQFAPSKIGRAHV